MPLLAIYLHWPFCRSKCPYCDFNSHVRERVEFGRWEAALVAELEHLAAFVPNRRVGSIFFGGGTPSLMPPRIAATLIERIHTLFPVAADLEITLEANPTSVETHTFPRFRQAGVNRVSLGVQSLHDEELRFLGRGHTAAEALRAIALAGDTFERFSFDLIYARPNQSLKDWESELTHALSLARGHLSLYQLTIEENTAFHHAYAKGGFTLPDEAAAEALYRLTETLMEHHGLPAYEVSNYAAPGQESRHNLSYWLGHDYLGIGPGAHGRITLPSPEGENRRIATQTLKSPERWLEAVERQGHGLEVWQPIDAGQDIEERLMMGLRLRDGIGYDAFKAQTGRNLADVIDEHKRVHLIQLGLLDGDSQRLRPTLKGRLVLNALTAELLK